MTLPQKILEVLSDGRPRCLGEIREAIRERYGEMVQDSTISARTRDSFGAELRSKRDPGKKYKVWYVEKREQAFKFTNDGQGVFA